MWYVIQTRSGEEQKLKELLEHLSEPPLLGKCLIPLYEDVWRKGGTGHISIRKLFPGYVLADTAHPEALYRMLKDIPKFTRLLRMEEKDGEMTFLSVRPEEEAFLRTILEDGRMHVSYIRRAKSGRIERIVGPLALYRNNIVKLDLPHRRAIVEACFFGKDRRLKFGLWTDRDPALPWLTEKLEKDGGRPPAPLLPEAEIGIHPGDVVRDDTGIYGDMELRVISVDPGRRTIGASAEMFGTTVRIEMDADSVRRG